MKVHVVFIIAVTVVVFACNNKEDSPAEWSDEEVAEWFSKGEWQHGFEITPDESINQQEMAIRYYRNPGRWEKAFNFLAEQNLEALDTGRYELDGTNLYATVSEYLPKDEDSTKFEAHRIYADIQYVVSGQEQISIVPIDEVVITEPYNEKKDILFGTAIDAVDRLATPERFFVLFPNDGHRPSVKSNPNDSTMVKKVVVKVKLEGAPIDRYEE